jgi:plasmid rolling circle replication initiator protein Rep
MGSDLQVHFEVLSYQGYFHGFYTCVQAIFNAKMWQMAFVLIYVFWVKILAQRPAILKEVYHSLSTTLRAFIRYLFLYLTMISLFVVSGVRCK